MLWLLFWKINMVWLTDSTATMISEFSLDILFGFVVVIVIVVAIYAYAPGN
jgi:hypothetical protein